MSRVSRSAFERLRKLVRLARHLAGQADIPREPTLARPAGRRAGRVRLRVPRKTRRRPAVGFVLELHANLVWRVGTGLAEKLATIFPKLFNNKFNEMRGPKICGNLQDVFELLFFLIILALKWYPGGPGGI